MQHTRICSVAASAPEGSGFQGTAAITLLLTQDYILDFVIAAVVERPSFHGMLSQSINTSMVASPSPRCPHRTSYHKRSSRRRCHLRVQHRHAVGRLSAWRHPERGVPSPCPSRRQPCPRGGPSAWRNVPCSGVPDEPTWCLAIRHGSAVRACSFTAAGRSASGIAAVSGENCQRLPTLSLAPCFLPGVAGSRVIPAIQAALRRNRACGSLPGSGRRRRAGKTADVSPTRPRVKAQHGRAPIGIAGRVSTWPLTLQPALAHG